MDSILELSFTKNRERMITYSDVKMTLLGLPPIQYNFCLLLNLKWMKDDSSGGRKEKSIELGMRFWKKEWITRTR